MTTHLHEPTQCRVAGWHPTCWLVVYCFSAW